jgi:hypothetical protein
MNLKKYFDKSRDRAFPRLAAYFCDKAGTRWTFTESASSWVTTTYPLLSVTLTTVPKV